VNLYTAMMLAGGLGSGCNPAVGKCGRIGNASPEEKTKLQDALNKIPDKYHNNVTVHSSDLGRSHGRSKGKNIYIDRQTIAQEHPLFLAAVIRHEMAHSGQDFRTMDSDKREFDARMKTRDWIINQSSQSKEDKEGMKALNKAWKLQGGS